MINLIQEYIEEEILKGGEDLEDIINTDSIEKSIDNGEVVINVEFVANSVNFSTSERSVKINLFRLMAFVNDKVNSISQSNPLDDRY